MREIQLEKPDTSRLLGHLERVQPRPYDLKSVPRGYADAGVQTARPTIIRNQPPEMRNRHQDSPAHIAGLPFHPIVFGGIQDGVALADRLVAPFGQSNSLSTNEPIGPRSRWKVEVAEFVSQRRAQPIFGRGSFASRFGDGRPRARRSGQKSVIPSTSSPSATSPHRSRASSRPAR